MCYKSPNDLDIKRITELKEYSSRRHDCQDGLPLNSTGHFGISSILQMAYCIGNDSPMMEEA